MSFFVQLSLGHLAVLWELGVPTLVLGELSEIRTCCNFTSNNMILLSAHLQNKVSLLVKKKN